MAVMEAVDVTRCFGRLTAVDGVDVSVGRGDVVGLLGANGAGKTTLVKMLLGLLPPTRGAVRIFGQPPSAAVRMRIGYMPQSVGLYGDLTVTENLAFLAGAYRVTPPIPPAGTGRVLVRDLPLGLRRRVAFAAVTAHRPELLVLDEPTSGVSPLARARLWDAIRQAADDGTAVLVTTHHLGEAEQCDRLLVLAAGRAVAAGTVVDVIGDRSAVEVRAARWDEAFTALDAAGLRVGLVGTRLRVVAASEDQVRATLMAAGVRAEVVRVPATLEEAFVELAVAA